MTLADICNMALDQINASPSLGGTWSITAAELTTPTTPQGLLLSRNHIEWIQEVMRDVDWASLTSRVKLVGNGTTTLTLVDTTTPGAFVANDIITVTPAVAYFTSKDIGRLLFEQPAPGSTETALQGTATITAVSAVPIPVATAKINFRFTSLSLPTLNVQGWGLAPLAEFQRAYQIPTDSLKIRRILDSTGAAIDFFLTHGRLSHGGADPWQVEAGFILTDVGNPIALYTYYEPDPTVWDKGLREAVVAKIAAEMTWAMTKNEKLKIENFQLYEKKKAEADASSKEERQRRGYSPTTFLDVRG